MGAEPRVVVDARMPAYTGAGIARYVKGLLGGFAALGTPCVTALLARRERGAWPAALGSAGIALRRAATPCHHRLERWALPLEVARLRPDLFHAVDHVGPALAPFPTVVTVHDLAFWRYPWTHSAASRRHYAAAATTLPRAAAVICVSESVRNDLLRALPLRPERVVAVHNGLDTHFRPAPDMAVLRRLGVRPPYLLAVGTIEDRKNLPLLLEAVHRLGRPELQVVLAGAEGFGADAVWRAAERLALADRLLHLRPSDAALVALYSSAAALAFPSRYEGFAFPPLEAMACGAPVVAADAGSVPEVCGEGAEAAAALVAPTADAFAAALGRVLDDAPYRADLIARGFARARRFTWERCARETFAVYRLALGG